MDAGEAPTNITLIPKRGKCPKSISNWRPITLLSVFYKTISGAFAERLKTVLPYLIHINQKAYLTGRTIADVVKNVMDIMYMLQENEEKGMLLLIDFSKAFDSIDHDFLFNMMELFGFGEAFINNIKTLISHRTSQVNLNGFMTKKFELQRGVPQGDPISAYLFILCIEVLAHKLRSNKRIKRITLPDGTTVLTEIYADDMTILLPRDPDSLRETIKTIDDFGKISGLKIDIDKTVATFIGADRDEPRICTDLTIKWANEFVLLGEWLYNSYEMTERNYDRPHDAMMEQIKAWLGRVNTPMSKVMLTKTKMISQMTHHAIVLPSPSDEFFQKWRRNFSMFIWKKSTPKMTYERMEAPIAKGGMGAINLKSFFKLLKMSWIRKGIDGDDTWTRLLNTHLNNNNIANVSELIEQDDRTIDKLAEDTSHSFWKECLTALAEVKRNYQRSHKDRAAQCSPFNNSLYVLTNIPGKPAKFEQPLLRENFTQIATHVNIVRDLIDENDQIMNKESFELKFQTTVNILSYKTFQFTIKTVYNELPCLFQNRYNSLELFISKTKGTNAYRRLENIKHPAIKDLDIFHKWTEKIPRLTEVQAQQCFIQTNKAKIEARHKSLQFRIINRIIGVKHHTWRFTHEVDRCTFCELIRLDLDPDNSLEDLPEETIEHLFYECHSSQTVIQQFFRWTPYTELGGNSTIGNFLVYEVMEDKKKEKEKFIVNILVKAYLFKCQKSRNLPNIIGCKQYVVFNAKTVNYAADHRNTKPILAQFKEALITEGIIDDNDNG